MKKKCIIHIGMHKTGSSSIQHSLYSNLKDDVFTYLDVGKANHSILLSMFFRDLSPQSEKYAEIKNRLIKKIEESNPVMIISAEAVSMFSKEKLVNLRDFLLHYFQEIRIVGYIRSPKSYMESFFQQRVKGGLASFDLDNAIYPHYRERFEKFDEVFGKNNVEFGKFDPKHLYKGNVVMDFCKRIGIDMTEDRTIRINESLSKEEVSVLYTFGKLGTDQNEAPGLMQKNMKLIRRIREIKKHKFKFSPVLIKPVLEKNRDDIAWMEERLGQRLEEIMVEGEEDIKCEADLLNIDRETIVKLRTLAGEEFSKERIYDNTQLEVAALIDMLHKRNRLNIMDAAPLSFARQLTEKYKEDLGDIDEEKIVLILEKTFSHIRHKLKNTNRHKVSIPQFVTFHIEMKNAADKTPQKGQKKIVFTFPEKE